MKWILLFFVFLFSVFNSQIIKDSVLGKPRYVKESVIFINDSGPYTFLRGDNEYGHAVIMTPKNLRGRMKETWFETHFCRYINNETFYDKNRNVTKETWYYRSGEIVDDYDYTFDNLNRLILEKRKNEYSEISYRYFYNGNNKTIKFKEAYYKKKDKPVEKYIANLDSFKPLFVTKFDTISKTDSIFAVTNDIWKKYNDGHSYIKAKDSIYHKKLSRVKTYDKLYRVIEEKVFRHEDDFQNKKIVLGEHFKYEYDNYGNLTKKINFSDGNLYSYIVSENGKIIKEEKKDNAGKTSYTLYTYTKDQKLESETTYYNDKLGFEKKFEYKGNYIIQLYYLDKFGREDEQIEPTIIKFKYSFDKHNNWTQVIKNVNGKDLYKWIRKIEYY